MCSPLATSIFSGGRWCPTFSGHRELGGVGRGQGDRTALHSRHNSPLPVDSVADTTGVVAAAAAAAYNVLFDGVRAQGANPFGAL